MTFHVKKEKALYYVLKKDKDIEDIIEKVKKYMRKSLESYIVNTPIKNITIKLVVPIKTIIICA